MTDINSKQYWDDRFSTDWVSAGGHGQTRFFAMIAARAMPKWLKDLIQQEKLQMCDWGCAEGQGVDELGKWIGTNSITGVDISEVAIEKARAAFPDAQFKAQSLDQLDEYDVVFSSNTLEHFNRPFEVMEQLAQRAKRFLVVLLPFQEYERISEHFFTFDFDNMPVSPAPGFAAVACRVVDAARVNINYWNGKQILVVYARLSTLGDLRPDLGNLFVGDDSYEAFAQARNEEIVRQHLLQTGELSQARGELAAALEQIVTMSNDLADSRAKSDAVAHQLTADRNVAAAQLARMHEEATERASALERLQRELGDARQSAVDLERQREMILRSRTWRMRNAILKLVGR